MYYAITVVPFFLHFIPSVLLPLPPASPCLSARPWSYTEVLWLLHFLYYSYPPFLLCAYQLCFLLPVPFPTPVLPIPVLVVYLVFVCVFFFFRFIC